MPLRPIPAALAATALLVGQANALSCPEPDLIDTFSYANAADEVYVIVLGQFSGGPGPRDAEDAGKVRTYRATFAGQTLDAGGPAEAFNGPVIVTEACAEGTCAELDTDGEVLTFLRQSETGGSPILVLDPCYRNFFPEPSEEQIQSIQDCFAAGCTAS